jgi:hypothetical protein
LTGVTTGDENDCGVGSVDGSGRVRKIT